MRRIALVATAACAAVVAIALVRQERAKNDDVRPAPRITTARSGNSRPPIRAKRPAFSWPTYGFDAGRSHALPASRLRPPFRRVWTMRGDWSLIEFPPVLADERLFFGTHEGRVYAISARTGAVVWKREYGRCIAASPAIAENVVYVALMGTDPCTRIERGFVVALDTRTGREIWRVASGVVESSPLVAGRRVYYGSWDGRIYAVDTRTHRKAWTFQTRAKVTAGVALWRRMIYAVSYDGNAYALDARTGRVVWRSTATSGHLYATPTVAGGRVFLGATTGDVYALSARTGTLQWRRRLPSFVYSPAAVRGTTLYVGSYDHRLYALDMRNGAVKWSAGARGPVSGAPTVLGGFVYFSSCGSCSTFESDPSARRTYAVDAVTGALRWRFADGEYSPMIADRTRAYLTGFTSIYALEETR